MKVYRIKSGFCYKELKSGKKKRISKDEYLKLSKSKQTKKSSPKQTTSKIYRTKNGYFYKELKNGKKKRISKEEYLKLNKKKKYKGSIKKMSGGTKNSYRLPFEDYKKKQTFLLVDGGIFPDYIEHETTGKTESLQTRAFSDTSTRLTSAITNKIKEIEGDIRSLNAEIKRTKSSNSFKEPTHKHLKNKVKKKQKRIKKKEEEIKQLKLNLEYVSSKLKNNKTAFEYAYEHDAGFKKTVRESGIKLEEKLAKKRIGESTSYESNSDSGTPNLYSDI